MRYGPGRVGVAIGVGAVLVLAGLFFFAGEDAPMLNVAVAGTPIEVYSPPT